MTAVTRRSADRTGSAPRPRRQVLRPPVPQSAPSRHTSCFQIGALAFSASMAKRAASNASARCGALTDGDDRALAQVETAGAVDQHDPPGLGPAQAQLDVDRFEARHDLRLVGLVGQRLDLVTHTPDSSTAWSRTVPLNSTTAPHCGSTAHS